MEHGYREAFQESAASLLLSIPKEEYSEFCQKIQSVNVDASLSCAIYTLRILFRQYRTVLTTISSVETPQGGFGMPCPEFTLDLQIYSEIQVDRICDGESSSARPCNGQVACACVGEQNQWVGEENQVA